MLPNHELILQARRTNIANYLLSIGEPLKRNGFSRYKHITHDSLVFKGNCYFWNSLSQSGNGIDFLIKHKNMTFKQAVEALTGVVPQTDEKNKESYSTKINIEPSRDCKQAIAYLNKTRCIDYNIVVNLIKNNLILQDNMNNVVFLMKNENNEYVGAELCGTTQKRFKGIKEHSRYGYGFNVRYSKNNVFKYVLFFEGAIDALSFIDIKLNFEHKSLENCLLVSMGGLKANVIKHTLNVFQGNLKTFVCIDNDLAGDRFIKELSSKNISFSILRPNWAFKDWNEYLVDVKS